MAENTESNSDANTQIVIKKSTFNKLIVGVIVASIITAFLAGYVIGVETTDSSKTIIQNTPSSSTSGLAPSQPNIGSSELISFVSIDDDPMKGDPSAPITIIEFSDFQCPFCGRFYANTLPLIEKNYIETGKVNFVYRDFPIQSIHQNAVAAAVASECADEQDAFWLYHDMVFENKQSWENLQRTNVLSEFTTYAKNLGLNTAEFNSCLESGKYIDEVNNDYQEGISYGVDGTPGFFIGNEKIGFTKVSGAKPYPIFQEILDEMIVK